MTEAIGTALVAVALLLAASGALILMWDLRRRAARLEALREAINSGRADAMPMQAYLLLSAMQGWRGDKATQVRESLEAFLAEQERAQR